MKNYIRSIKTIFLFATISAALCFTACNLMNEEPGGFLKDYGTVVYVKSVEFVDASGNALPYVEQGGYKNFAGDAELNIIYHLENPGSYELLQDPDEFDLPPLVAFANNDPSVNLTGVLEFVDSSTIKLEVGGFASTDGNPVTNNISPTITLYRADGRPQSAYTINMRCNTPPGKITDGIGQKIEITPASGGATERLALCAKLPTLKNDDILLTVKAGGTTKYFEISGGVVSGTSTDGAWTYSSSAGALSGGLTATYEGGPTVSGQNCFIETDIENFTSKAPFPCTISITDAGGLTSSCHPFVSHGRKLAAPTGFGDSSGTLDQDDDGASDKKDYGTYTLTVANSNATIHYTIMTPDESGEVYKTGSGVGKVDILLYPNEDGSEKTYKITQAYATLEGWEDSDDGASAMGNNGVIKITGSKLDPPEPNGTSFNLEDKETIDFILTAPQKGTTIEYGIAKMGVTSIPTVTAASPVTVKLSAGGYVCNAKATKKYHIDSDEFVANTLTGPIKVVSYLRFVSKDGDDLTGNGTRSSPYATFEAAVDSFGNESDELDSDGNPLCTVIFLTNMTLTSGMQSTVTDAAIKLRSDNLASPVTFYCNDLNTTPAFTVSGTQNFVVEKINFAQSSSSGYNKSPAISVTGGSLTLKDCSISGIKFNADSAYDIKGAVTVTDGSIKMQGRVVINNNIRNSKPCNLYLADGKQIELLDSLASGSKIGITTQTAPSIGATETTVKLTDGFEEKCGASATPSTYFTSDAGFVVKKVDTEAHLACASAGGNITPPITPPDVTFELSAASGTSGTILVYAKDGATTIQQTKMSDWHIEMYYGIDHVATSTTNSVEIPLTYPAGSYVIKVSAKYKYAEDKYEPCSGELLYTKN